MSTGHTSLSAPNWLTDSSDGVVVRVRVQPRASRSEVCGEYGEGYLARLKIRIAAPPVDGTANEEVVRFVADRLGVARSCVRIVRGAASRAKDLMIEGVPWQEVVARLKSD